MGVCKVYVMALFRLHVVFDVIFYSVILMQLYFMYPI